MHGASARKRHGSEQRWQAGQGPGGAGADSAPRLIAGLLLASLLALASPAPAANGEEPGLLTLTGAVALAGEGAPVTRAGRFAIAAEEEAAEQARARLLPNVTTDASIAYSEFETSRSTIDPQTLAFESRTEEVEQSSRSVGLSLSQPVYDREAWTNLTRAQTRTDLARTQLGASRQQVTRQVAETYLTVLRERETLGLAQAERRALQLRVEQLRDRAERGLSTRLDVLDAQVRLEEVEARIAAAENAADAAVIELQRLIGQPFEALQGADVSAVEGRAPPTSEQIAAWSQGAVSRSPDVRVAEQELAVARDTVEVRSSARYPRLSVEARYSDTDRTDQVVSGEQARVMLQLRMPLYSGGGVSAGVEEARARAQAQQARLDEARRAGFVEVRRVANELRAAVRSIGVLQRSLETSRERVRAVERGLGVGLRDQVELLEARARVFEIRRDLTAAVYDRLLAEVRILSLTGELNRQRLQDLEQQALTARVALEPEREPDIEPDYLPE